MSSKAVGQQQGRRTPLSLTGGKNSHQQQSQSLANKNFKNQESKDSTNNKNNNQAAKNQQESRDLPSTQKDIKKTQQNGSKHVTADNGNDDIVFMEQNGTANGTSNNSNDVSNKNNAKSANQATNKDNKEKEKDKEPEPVNEKPGPKSKKVDASKAIEKKENDASEKQATTATPPTNSNKSTDGSSTPTSNAAAIEKKQNAQTSTPTKSNTTSNAHRISSTPSKPEIAEKLAATSPTKLPVAATTKTATTSKSQKAAGDAAAGSAVTAAPVKEKTPEVIEISDNDIEPLIVESSPPKKSTARNAITPAATSTPGKTVSDKQRGNNVKSDIQLTMETRSSVDRKSVPRSFSDISGRRSIRSLGDYTPGMYNAKYRESYRRINTELDVTGNTNTSMNVTVGSEIPNTSSFLSFSLFGRGRKRERTPPSTLPNKSQSAVELTVETTPPKRARLDGIFSAMASPLTMLRTRFSKATLETPAKAQQPTMTDDVQNLSGVSIEEVVSSAEVTATEDITVGKEDIAEKSPSKTTPVKEMGVDEAKELEKVDDSKGVAMDDDGDIIITETPIIPAVGEPKMKQRGCLIM